MMANLLKLIKKVYHTFFPETILVAISKPEALVFTITGDKYYYNAKLYTKGKKRFYKISVDWIADGNNKVVNYLDYWVETGSFDHIEKYFDWQLSKHEMRKKLLADILSE